jgi:hypothetical protein
MAEQTKKAGHEVHELLLDARPEAGDVNLAKAAHLAEATGAPREDLQFKTFIAIKNIQTAIESGASAAEAEHLLMHAVGVASHWATAS